MRHYTFSKNNNANIVIFNEISFNNICDNDLTHIIRYYIPCSLDLELQVKYFLF